MGAVARVPGLLAASLIIGVGAYLWTDTDSKRQLTREPTTTGTAAGQPGKLPGGNASSVILSRAQFDMVKVEVVGTRSFDRGASEAPPSPAVPVGAMTHDGDGSTMVWVMTDLDRFDKRTVRVGGHRDGFAQILEGLRPGEFIATVGTQFLSNALAVSRCSRLGDVVPPDPRSRAC